jgi:DNA polymerase III delta prime subunit
MYRGPKVALAAAPKARYGAYVTVDRDEIERINAIRNLILSYQGNPDDRRPLSIAVFGPPGSGKSFAIKQLAAELFGKQKAVLEFNLAQLDRLEDLHSAFHQVRDASIRGQTPLVFWDEFDSQGLRWLQQFLAPMQDAEFRAGNATHPLGKAIFVFAGGTSSTFAKFNRPADGSAEWESFKGAKKGPDFISRLRGFVDIKGPNPIGRTDSEATGPQAGREPQPQWDDAARGDAAHLMRRAITLRAILERDHPSLIDEATGLASVSPGVVRALLRVRSYLHGARSLESVVKMSALPRASEFRAADLPSADQLGFHVTPDFLDHVRLGQLEIPIVEALAEACHEAWRELREAAGWTWGPTRDDAQRKHPLLVPYAQLSEKDKEANRVTARQSEAKLHAVGFAIERAGESARSAVSAEEYSAAAEELAKIEHDIWLRDRLLEGYEWAETSNPQLRQHPDVAPFEALGSREQDIDRAIVRSIPGTLERHGYRLVKAG